MKYIYVAFLCLLGSPVYASEIKQCPKSAEALKAGDYQQALVAAHPQKCPTLHTLAKWYLLKDGHPGIPFDDYQDFLDHHSNWPWLPQLRTFGEKALTPAQSLSEIEHFYQGSYPKTVNGLTVYVDKLLEQDQQKKATQLIRQTWHQVAMSPEKTREFISLFQPYLTQADYQKRADYFLIKPDLEQAEMAISYITQNKLAFETRLKLLQKAENGHELYQRLDPASQTNPEVLLAYLKWMQVKEDPAAPAFFNQHKSVFLKHSERFWKVYNALARDAILETQYDHVFDYLGDLDLPPGEAHADTQFLLGWVSLRNLDDPKQAITYFKSAYDQVKTGMSQARFAYWLGRAYEALGDQKQAASWYRKASHFGRTYYGQLSAEALGVKPNITHFKKLTFSPADQQAVEKMDLVKAVRILHTLKLFKDIPAFYYSLRNACQTQGQKQYFLYAVNKLAPRYTVEVARLFGYSYDFKEAYKQLSPQAAQGLPVAPAFVEAIIRKESGFDPLAVSPAKAQGLMQLMFDTAAKLSKELKIPYRPEALLSDPAYNVKLGSTYIAQVLAKYDGHKPMALAAYNAGPGRVNKWIKNYGDPRSNEIDTIDWIELIPFSETRNYVQRVSEYEAVYQALRDLKVACHQDQHHK